MLAAEQEQLAKERAAARKDMVSTGDRSAKIRTYNFPQGRITDHRINFTAYNLDGVMDGDIGELIENLILADQQLKLSKYHNSLQAIVKKEKRWRVIDLINWGEDYFKK